MSKGRAGQGEVLVCFAVKEEARPFLAAAKGMQGVRVLVTGMGEQNSRHALVRELPQMAPDLVLTCGFAGALNPQLMLGNVLCSFDADPAMIGAFKRAGMRPGTFHCALRVATTGAEKAALWKKTSADAVEMESGCIRAICQERGILAATVRVILDSASEDLPLDFNELMTPDKNLNPLKLAAAIVRAPEKIAGLIRLQRQSRLAALALAGTLTAFLTEWRMET